MQHEPITAAVQPAPHVRAPTAIIDLIAVTNVEPRFGAVPPDGAGDEPGKRLRKPRIEPAGIDGASNINKNVGAATGPVAGRPIWMVSADPIEDSGSMKEVVDQGIDDNEARPDGEPTRPTSPGPHQQRCQRHRDDLVGNPIDMPKRVDEGGPGCRKVAGMVGELPINPVDDVPTGNVPDEQE
jgi:hypothetical protein